MDWQHQLQKIREFTEQRRALKAAGKLPTIKIVKGPHQGGKPHDRGEDRPEGWEAPQGSRTDYELAE